MMGNGVGDLTDKEREALRLLLAGHDAKSSAAKLDLSVHTINDRLRNARRKLNVSSSREAARILGVAEGVTERQSPQNSAYTSFGIADVGDGPDTAILNNTEPKRSFGLNWLAGGMLIMSLIIAAAIIGVVYTSGESATAPAESVSASETAQSSASEASPAAMARARRFIDAIDAGDYKLSWSVAGEFFQVDTTADEWAGMVEPVRSPLGKVKERRLVSVQETSSLPGAPEGDYEMLQYQTVFENEESISTETLVLIRNGSGFDVAAYFIR